MRGRRSRTTIPRSPCGRQPRRRGPGCRSVRAPPRTSRQRWASCRSRGRPAPPGRWSTCSPSGPGLVPVWDELDYAGVIDHWLPEWADIRLRGSSSPVHRFTVDRHSIETCVKAAEVVRDVDRPDLLAVGALLHDIGKGRPGDHSEVGEAMAVEIASAGGSTPRTPARSAGSSAGTCCCPNIATRRDIEDPSTAANVAEIVETAGVPRPAGRAHPGRRAGHRADGVVVVAARAGAWVWSPRSTRSSTSESPTPGRRVLRGMAVDSADARGRRLGARRLSSWRSRTTGAVRC